jgi:hypothetical protein
MIAEKVWIITIKTKNELYPIFEAANKHLLLLTVPILKRNLFGLEEL